MSTPYDIAKSYLGTTEIPGKKNNPLIVRWLKRILPEVDDDETAWCSAFANECAAEAGYERSGKANARSWLTVGEKIDLTKAKRGDVIILWRGSKDGWQGHVAFLDWYDNRRGLLYLLGGNQGDCVCISAFPEARLLGVRRLRTLTQLQGSTSRIV